jgi:uncharacterized protein YkwD
MLAKMAICAWSLYLGVDAKEVLQQRCGLDIANFKLESVQQRISAGWAELTANRPETPRTEENAEDAEGTKVRLIAIEKSVVEATNAERGRYGLPALEVDDELMKTAREHCTWMTHNETLRHTHLPVAENIAMGQESTEHVVRTWMGSSGHRANILNGAFRRIGVAAYQTPRGVIFWCQQFQRN